MTDIDITPHDLETVKRLVASYFPDVEARVFGSRYRWTAKDYSDLDIALVGSEKLDWYKVNQLREALAESDLPFRVDVLDWHAISPEFQRVIAAGYAVIHRGEAFAVQLRGHSEPVVMDASPLPISGAAEVPTRESSMSSSGWGEIRLGDIATIIDCPHSTPKWTDSGYFVVRNWNIRNGRLVSDRASYTDEATFFERIRRGKPEFGDLVLTREAPMGEVCMIPQDVECCLGQRVVLIKPNKEEIDPEFLLYSIQSPYVQNQINLHDGTGSTVSNLRIPAIHDLNIPLPPRAAQKRIADILSALDEKMELNRQTNATLEAIAQAIFREWFVQYNFPGAAGELVESELGLIPAGWRVQPLPEMIEINPSRMLKKGDIAPYLDMANMPTEGHRGIEWVDRAYSSGTKFVNGDTLLAKITPCLENGKTAFVDFLANGQTGWGSTEFIVLHPKPPLPPEYGYYLARSDALRNHAIQNMIGTSGRQRTPISSFESFLMVIPPEHIAVQFGEIASSVLAQVRAFDEEFRTLAQIRNALLPRLMRGEV